jgi:hypothetical protein
LIKPLFSATKMRPSEAKRRVVGFVRPLKATESSNPYGRTVAAACAGLVFRGDAPEMRAPMTRTAPRTAMRRIAHRESEARRYRT